MTNFNKGLSFITIIFFSVLFYYALSLPTSHKEVKKGQTIHTNVFGGVVEVTDTIVPDYSSEKAWADSMREVGYFDYEK